MARVPVDFEMTVYLMKRVRVDVKPLIIAKVLLDFGWDAFSPSMAEGLAQRRAQFLEPAVAETLSGANDGRIRDPAS